MLDLEDGTSDAFEQGRIIGRQEERANIKGIFHDAVSPELSVAILTLAETEKDLRAKHAPEADELAKVKRLIDKVIEKIVTPLEPHFAVSPQLQIWASGEAGALFAVTFDASPGRSESISQDRGDDRFLWLRKEGIEECAVAG